MKSDSGDGRRVICNAADDVVERPCCVQVNGPSNYLRKWPSMRYVPQPSVVYGIFSRPVGPLCVRVSGCPWVAEVDCDWFRWGWVRGVCVRFRCKRKVRDLLRRKVVLRIVAKAKRELVYADAINM